MRIDDEITEQLKDIFDIRNRLLTCDDMSSVIRAALEAVRDRLRSQTVSIFLLSKDGRLKRAGINGVDKQGKCIADDWYRNEQYEIGESFTGKAAMPVVNSRFGEPQWSSCLEREQIDERSRNAYKGKLGALKSAIAVPLNGRRRTFGVLEIINRLDNGDFDASGKEGIFSREEVYRLCFIGMSLATAISSLRRKNELDTLTEITGMLIKPTKTDSETHPVYQYTAQKLVNHLTYYKACFLRIGTAADTVELVAKAGDEIAWTNQIDEPLKKGEAITGEIYRKAEPVFVTNLLERRTDFKNYEWIKANQLKSYAGFPLKVDNRVIGTLSIFVGFDWEFYPNDVKYLNNISYLLASFARNLQVDDEIATLNEEINRERENIMSYARDVAFTREYEEVMHEYKDELFNILHALKTSEKSSLGRRSQIIQDQITWINKRVEEIKKSFGESSRAVVPVSLNHVIRGLTKLFTADKKRKLRFEFDLDPALPNLMANEAEMRDVVFNLVSNAVKAIEKGGQKYGEVDISTSVVEEGDIEYIQLAVEDNGIGIAQDVREQIYQKRFSTYQGGTGMGLHITKRIVNAYGGKINFASTVGKGTKFFVKIPLEWNQEEEQS